MKKFSINYQLDSESIKNLRKEEDFPYSTFSKLMIFMNGELITYNKSNFTDTEYLWYFFLHLLKVNLDLMKSKKDKVINLDFMDNPTTLKFCRYGGGVEISILSSVNREEKEELNKVAITLDELTEETKVVAKRFINELLEINPKLRNSQDINKFLAFLTELGEITKKTKSTIKSIIEEWLPVWLNERNYPKAIQKVEVLLPDETFLVNVP